ncbi:hypothetical protein HYV71_04745, partial [Candidatus Uhrbacteria bacterium]|nr:hypothetical protein [Candidatus Uhrbacteria bacterium]
IHFSEKIRYWHETKTPRIRFRTEQIKELVVHYSALGKYGYDTIERLVATRIRKAFVHELLHAAGLWHSKDATDAMFARQGDRIVRIPRSSVIGDRVTDEEGSSICLDDEMIIIKREVGEFDFFIGDESPAYAQITSDHPGSTDTSNVLARFLRYAALHIL